MTDQRGWSNSLGNGSGSSIGVKSVSSFLEGDIGKKPQ
jgi:hypothetical protein